MEFIEIDGSYGEGGGQVVRTAAALSCVTNKGVRISNIRAGRTRPGLSHQHIAAVKAVQALSGAEVQGLGKGNTEVSVAPGEIGTGSFQIDIGTAGSVPLVLQTVLLPALFSKGEVRFEIVGGTDVPMSPPMDYVENVYLPVLRRMGAQVDVKIIRRGHYPRGGGLVRAAFRPSSLKGVSLENRGELKGVFGRVHCTELPESIAERQKNAAIKDLQKRLDVKAEITTEVGGGCGAGTGTVLWATYENVVLGASCLGRIGKSAESGGREAVARLCSEIESGATVDSHMGGQLIPYAALATGESSFVCRLTEHTKTNIHVTEQILGTRPRIDRLHGGLVNIKYQNH
ncbi:MAG TPA: RNA 3'-terminal phosphate cyclase [Euryarchaeota archaeon]|nr:RNA 3'-terminal phosphate cyclase [Euryarchaeota archaeon]